MKKILLIALCALLALPYYAGTGGGTVTVAATIPAHAKPTCGLAGAGAGHFANGNHYVKVAYVTSTGVTTLSAASDVVNITDYTTDGKLSVTLVASARSEVASINIYVTKAAATSAGPYYLAKAGNANSNGAVTVDLATDEATNLTSAAPSTDAGSAAANTTISATAGKHFRSLSIRNTDATNRCYITRDGSDPVTSATTGSWSVGPTVTWGPVYMPSPQDGLNCSTIKLRFDTTGGVVSYEYTEDY